MQKIRTFLTYNGSAEEAAELYTSVFEKSRILSKNYYGESGPGEKGSVMTVTFELEGQEYVALNASGFTFTTGISLFVSCETQEEVDDLWEKLSDGGEQGPCGWLTDRFGVSWQIVPRRLVELLDDPDREKANRVMKAMLGMGEDRDRGARGGGCGPVAQQDRRVDARYVSLEVDPDVLGRPLF